MSRVVWSPSLSKLQKSKMYQLGVDLTGQVNPTQKDIYQYSISNRQNFWRRVWEKCSLIGKMGDSVIDCNINDPIASRWFPEAELNFAENLLSAAQISSLKNKPALVFQGEDQIRRTVSYYDLFLLVQKISQYYLDLGVNSGDTISGIVANTPETVASALAAANIGAIWCSVAPEFGPTGIIERFSQVNPKILISTDFYYYKGKKIDLLAKARQIQSEITSIKRLLILPYDLNITNNEQNDDTLETILSKYTATSNYKFKRYPFSHPLYCMFTSGTTGKPKALIHSAGGTLLEHKKELELHTNLTSDDTIFYQTTCAWMMWNWLISSLASGSKIILYDGFPLLYDGRHLLELIDKERISIFGSNPGFLRAVEKSEIIPKNEFSFDSLNTILTTGSRLHEDQFDYVYEKIKADVQLSSISGGTDIIGCFALGSPIAPVIRGELQCRSLGYQVECFSSTGESLTEEQGELVCTAPFPSMPIGLVGDNNHKKYKETYFSRFKNVWYHGDTITITKDGGLIVHDRSDDTLNASGVRIGPAEIYRQVLTFTQISDCVAVAQNWETDSRIILFVVMAEGNSLSEDLKVEINKKLRTEESPRHVPAKIISVLELPKTMSGKTSASAVRTVINGGQAVNTEALANPKSLEYFKNLPELMS